MDWYCWMSVTWVYSISAQCPDAWDDRNNNPSDKHKITSVLYSGQNSKFAHQRIVRATNGHPSAVATWVVMEDPLLFPGFSTPAEALRCSIYTAPCSTGKSRAVTTNKKWRTITTNPLAAAQRCRGSASRSASLHVLCCMPLEGVRRHTHSGDWIKVVKYMLSQPWRNV